MLSILPGFCCVVDCLSALRSQKRNASPKWATAKLPAKHAKPEKTNVQVGIRYLESYRTDIAKARCLVSSPSTLFCGCAHAQRLLKLGPFSETCA